PSTPHSFPTRRSSDLIPICAQVLSRVEAEGCGMSHRTGALSIVSGAVRLAGVFDYYKIVLAGDLQYGVHVRGLPVQMHGYDGFGPARDRGFQTRHVYRISIGVCIHQYRSSARIGDGEGGGD